MDIGTLQAWLPTVAAGGFLVLLWSDMRSTKKQLADKVNELSDAFKKLLYRDDGLTNFMPRSGCEREQGRCQNLMLGKIEALSVKMDLMDAKRETAKEQANKQIGDIKMAIATLSAHMLDGVTKSIQHTRMSE